MLIKNNRSLYFVSMLYYGFLIAFSLPIYNFINPGDTVSNEPKGCMNGVFYGLILLCLMIFAATVMYIVFLLLDKSSGKLRVLFSATPISLLLIIGYFVLGIVLEIIFQ
jgi:uncharacterized membrane protein